MSTLAKRFSRKWQADASSGCHVWTASVKPNGYGQIVDHKRTLYAHRVAWELARGPIPPDREICHTCDNRCCVNPEHMFLGTRKDNMADCRSKGRMAGGDIHGRRIAAAARRGAMHRCAKLADDDVKEIRQRYAAGEVSMRALARERGVTYATVWQIVSGRTWSHL